MNFFYVNKFLIFVIMIRSLITLLFLILISCRPMVNKNDIQKQCVIDSVYLKETKSTLDFDKIYVYHTDCNFNFHIRNIKSYEVGDTIILTIKTFENEK